MIYNIIANAQLKWSFRV